MNRFLHWGNLDYPRNTLEILYAFAVVLHLRPRLQRITNCRFTVFKPINNILTIMRSSILVLFSAIACAVATPFPVQVTATENVTTYSTFTLDERQVPVEIKATCIRFSPESIMPLKTDIRALAKQLRARTDNCGITRAKSSTDRVFKSHAKSAKTDVSLYFSNRKGTTNVWHVWYTCKKVGEYLDALADLCGKDKTTLAGMFFQRLAFCVGEHR